MRIRLEKPADRADVQDLITAAFRRAQNSAPVVEAILNDQLRRDRAWPPEFTLVAELDGAVVGQVTSSSGTIEPAGNTGGPVTVVAVGPVSVRPEHQRAGIGSALMRDLMARVGDADEPLLVLLGSPDFYGRFGFVPASSMGIETPDPSWGGYFQVKQMLSRRRIPVGRFRYAAPFEALP